mgnify:CR=1 FL=1
MPAPPRRPALRLIPGGGPSFPPLRRVPDATVERAVAAVVATSGGLPRRLLTTTVQSWLWARHPGEVLPDHARILRSLGMCMVRGEVDARGVLLLPGPALGRAALSG